MLNKNLVIYHSKFCKIIIIITKGLPVLASQWVSPTRQDRLHSVQSHGFTTANVHVNKLNYSTTRRKTGYSHVVGRAFLDKYFVRITSNVGIIAFYEPKI